MNTLTKEDTIIRDLGDGLILRHATAKDADVLCDFNAKNLTDNPEEPQQGVGVWTHDLLSRPHPTFQPGDFTIVEEQATGRVISSLNLIPQTWEYGGMIQFGVGRPEVVSTLPEFRHRGLVRTQFEVIHQWSAERGHVLQAITGIPTYYRQFGYEMAMELDGGRAGYEPQLPKLKDGETEPFTLRPASEADIPFLMDVYAYGTRRSLMRCVRDQAIWRYEMFGQSEKNIQHLSTLVIENAEGEAVGYVRHPFEPWSTGMVAVEYELKPGVSWLAVSPAVARYLWKCGEALMQSLHQKRTIAWGFWLGSAHPVYNALKENLPRVRAPYAWYIRIPDLPGFLRLIAPVLEKRIAESIAVGHTGKLRINRSKTMLMLVFEEGKLVSVEEEKRNPTDYGDLQLPGLLIHQLIFGYRSFDDLRAAFPDVYADNDIARAVLEILFPKQYARILPVS